MRIIQFHFSFDNSRPGHAQVETFGRDAALGTVQRPTTLVAPLDAARTPQRSVPYQEQVHLFPFAFSFLN